MAEMSYFFNIISEDITFISSEEITINVQKRGISSEKTRINVHSCTD